MHYPTISCAGVAVLALAGAYCFPADLAVAQTSNLPAFMGPTYGQALAIPSFSGVGTAPPAVIQQTEQDTDPTGFLGTFQPGGATQTSTNAFFLSLGTNGRTCFSCHQPASGMGISVSAVNNTFRETNGTDPIFAPVDGANCPNTPQNHSLLLNKGLFRIFLPVPKNAQYTLKVVSDPTGCNTNKLYNTDPTTGQQIVSVYRRPLIATNLKFVITTVCNLPGAPSPCFVLADPTIDPSTGLYESGNIMWDGREPTLQSQATDATLVHAQAKTAPTAQQIAQIVAFEDGVYSAQSNDSLAGPLNANGATGGPVNLSLDTPTCADGGVCAPLPVFNEYNAWSALAGSSSATEQRESIYRGMLIFNGAVPAGIFNILDVSGLNNLVGANPVPGSCSTCHNDMHNGSDQFQLAQHDIGIGGTAGPPNPPLSTFGSTVTPGFGPSPSPNLPIFELTCPSATPTRYRGNVVYTNDPGQALISGKCTDIGQLSVPPLRGLASRDALLQ